MPRLQRLLRCPPHPRFRRSRLILQIFRNILLRKRFRMLFFRASTVFPIMRIRISRSMISAICVCCIMIRQVRSGQGNCFVIGRLRMICSIFSAGSMMQTMRLNAWCLSMNTAGMMMHLWPRTIPLASITV